MTISKSETKTELKYNNKLKLQEAIRMYNTLRLEVINIASQINELYSIVYIENLCRACCDITKLENTVLCETDNLIGGYYGK